MVLVLAGSCDNAKVEKPLEQVIAERIAPRQEPPEHVYDDTTFSNNGHLFSMVTYVNGHGNAFDIYRDDKIVLKDTIDNGGLSSIELIDFDKDGFSDILISYIANNTTELLYLFDKTSNNFEFIENFISFPDAVQLKNNPRFYYSYSRAGCADMNWESDLFYIKDSKIIPIGHIDGFGCDDDVINYSQSIKVYRTNRKEKMDLHLLETLPYKENVAHFDNKWNFIEAYWNKNYKKFQ